MATGLAEHLGILANIMTSASYIPKIVRSYRHRQPEDSTLTTFIFLFLSQICWLIYAIILQWNQFIIASSIEIVLLIAIVIAWYRFTPNKII